MKRLASFAITFLLTAISFGQTNWRDTTRRLSDSCINLQNEASKKILPGTNHSMPLIVANGIIISGDEIKKKLVDSIFIIKCPESFERFGNIGALGVIYLNTKQKFETINITSVVTINQSHGARQKIIYAINGYLFADTILRISKNAIKKVEILKDLKVDSLDTNSEVTCISIWTLTKKEIRAGIQFRNHVEELAF
jgi:hypothetical protein